MTTKLTIWTKDEIKSDQDKIRKGLLGLDQSIHANAVQCLMHAEKHGDASLFTRLLTEIIDAKTGYRRQGLVNWMRKFSPMELKGSKIDLSGIMTEEGKASLIKQFTTEVDPKVLIVGAKRPFLVDLANKTPFWTDQDNAERVAKRVFQTTALAKVDAMIREVLAAAENTVNGQPVDPSKPFYDGTHLDTVVDFATKVKIMRDALPVDLTKEVRDTQARIAKDIGFVEQNAPKAAVGAVEGEGRKVA